MFKACIFDLDGTLADSVESIAYCANKAITECGLYPNEVYKYKKFAGDGAAEMLKRSLTAAGDYKLRHFEYVKKRYMEILAENCLYKVVPYPAIPEALHEIKKQGMKSAVLTNKIHTIAVNVVESLFGKGYFDIIQGQSEQIPRKPSPEGAFFITGKLGLNPEECIYIGDTKTDMITGNSAGMFTVGVTWGFRDRKELEEHHACKIIDDPKELSEFIRSYILTLNKL